MRISRMYVNLLCILQWRNLGDMCSRSKQTEILLNVWRGKDVTGV